MSEKQPTAESFLADTGKHEIEVLMDSGVYRHVKFKQPHSWNMWFELITWPGNLCIAGDMGTFVFKRVHDMFTFFRCKELQINADYWAEKGEAFARNNGGPKVFDRDIYRRNILDSLEGYDLDYEQRMEIIEALGQVVFNQDGQEDAFRALSDFQHGDFTFSDAWEISSTTWSYHFLWCLFAIVRGIQIYDANKTAALGGSQ